MNQVQSPLSWDAALDQMQMRVQGSDLLLAGELVELDPMSDLESLGPIPPESRARAENLYAATVDAADRLAARMQAIADRFGALQGATPSRTGERVAPRYVDRSA